MLATPQVDSQEKTGEGSEVLAKTADEEGLEAESQMTIQGRTEGEFEHETESKGDLESEGMMEEELEDDVKNISSVIFR